MTDQAQAARQVATPDITDDEPPQNDNDLDEVKIDLHVHGQWSPDAIGDLDRLAQAARRKGLHALALTEHDTTAHHKAIKSWNREHKDGFFRFFPGIEVTTRQGHLLAIGTQEPIEKGLDVEETVERVQAAGGIAIPAHCYRWRTGIGEASVARIARKTRLLETWNAQETHKKNRLARRLAEEHGLGATGGSDAHQVHDVGNGHTVLPHNVDDLDDLISLLERAKSRAAGTLTPQRTRLRQRARIAVRSITRRHR